MKELKKYVKWLYLAGLVFVVYSFYTGVLAPLIMQNNQLKQDINIKDAEVQTLYTSTLNYGRNLNTLKNVAKTSQELLEQFYADDFQEEYIETINQWLKDSNMAFYEIESAESVELTADWATYGIEDPSIVPVVKDEEEQVEQERESLEIERESLENFAGQGILVDMTGTYEDVQKFMEYIQKSHKNVVSNEIELERVTTFVTLNGTSITDDKTLNYWLDNQGMPADMPPIDPDEYVNVACLLNFVSLDSPMIDYLDFDSYIVEDYEVPESFINGEYKNHFLSGKYDWLNKIGSFIW